MQLTKSYPTPKLSLILASLILITAGSLQAAVSVNNLFGDHMVLQRNTPLPVWGSADPGEAVTVRIGENAASTVTGEDGSWSVSLAPMQAGGPHMLVIEGTSKLVFEDVLIGEVWVASGQSNMQWNVGNSINGDLDKLLVARNSQIRLIPVKNRGSQEPQDAFPGIWTVAEAGSVEGFSAVAYSFAETLHATLGVPVGIIENSWGGSSAEAWVSRSVIAEDPTLNSIHTEWLETEATYDFAAEKAAAEVALAEWEVAAAAAREAGQPEPNKPRPAQDKMTAQHRPGNLWNARVLPVIPYSIRGTIWYQGESNARRGLQYRNLFPTLISEWRKAWKSDFPFYWVQLADFQKESDFSPDDPWPVLREAQTLTMNSVPHTGQAVIIDLGEGKDIHPRHKEEVGRRLARWALNRDYGYTDLVFRSPEFAAFSQEEDKLVVKFNYTGGGLRPFDTKEVKGFVVQTETGGWQLVEGTVTSADTVELALPDASPVTALRYAWADNPVCNLFSEEGLPVTPFRTDTE